MQGGVRMRASNCKRVTEAYKQQNQIAASIIAANPAATAA
jgi:hypothetical protein